MCSVPIEKDEGCAQMMCKRCKHVFCWYCLASLDVSIDRFTHAAAVDVQFISLLFFSFHSRTTFYYVTMIKDHAKISLVIHVPRLYGIELK